MPAPSDDELDEDGKRESNNSGGTSVFISGHAAAIGPKRGLLKFNLASIPNGAVATAASLVITPGGNATSQARTGNHSPGSLRSASASPM